MDEGTVRQPVTIVGTFTRDVGDWAYIPVDVPPGVSRLDVEYRYDRPEVESGELGNACDLGVFDERGFELDGPGFRGWSGGARTGFFISGDDATPGYLPGAVNAGRWHVLLAPYHVAPQGLRYEIDVRFTFGPALPTPEPTYPPAAGGGPAGRRWVRGDCHVHTVYSDGRRTPEELATAARAGRLDFIISSEHNTTSAHRHWAPHAGDDLLIALGEEVTTRNGHWLALGTPPETWIDWRFRAGGSGFADAAAQVRSVGGLVVAAHPFAPCLGCRFKHDLTHAEVVEVWNGPWTPDDEAAVLAWDNLLVSGRQPWLPAMGNSDSHAFDQPVGLPQTVVEVDELSVAAVTSGLREGRSWIAESADIELTFSASLPGCAAVGIGGRVESGEAELVDVHLVVDGVPDGDLMLVTDQGVVRRVRCDPAGHGDLHWQTTAARSSYVRAEVRYAPTAGYDPETALPSAMAAMTNPIWLGRSGRR